MSPTETQVGGDHYKKYPLSPFEFAQVNGWDTGTSYILKHVTRHRDKAGREDLLKAIHYVELRQEVMSRYNTAHFRPYEPTTPVIRYVTLNKIPKAEALILDLLELWIRNPGEVVYPEKIKRKLLDLADAAYPQEQEVL